MKTKARKILFLFLVQLNIVSCIQKATDFKLEDVHSHRVYQDKFLVNDKFSDKVITEYKHILDSNPNSEFANYYYGRVVEEDKYKYFDLSNKINPSFYWAKIGLADYYLNRNQFLCIDYAKQAIKIDNNYYLGYYIAGLAYMTFINNNNDDLSKVCLYAEPMADMFHNANNLKNKKYEDKLNLSLELVKICSNVVYSIENTQKCLVGYDWVFPSGNNPTAAWKFSSDGTFNYSTVYFGGMTAWGNWQVTSPGKIKISYTRTSLRILPDSKILTMSDCGSLKVGTSVYLKN